MFALDYPPPPPNAFVVRSGAHVCSLFKAFFRPYLPEPAAEGTLGGSEDIGSARGIFHGLDGVCTGFETYRQRRTRYTTSVRRVPTG